jgi:hypothetical protein
VENRRGATSGQTSQETGDITGRPGRFATLARSPQFLENPLAGSLPPWHVLLERAPDLNEIAPQIGVNEHIANASQRRPGNLGPSFLGGVTESLRGFGHRLEISKHSVLHKI